MNTGIPCINPLIKNAQHLDSEFYITSFPSSTEDSSLEINVFIPGIEATLARVLSVMNLVDVYYKTMNTRIVLNDVIIWTEGNVVPVTTNGVETLNAFSNHVKEVFYGEMKLKFDHAHFLIYKSWGSLAGTYELFYVNRAIF